MKTELHSVVQKKYPRTVLKKVNKKWILILLKVSFLSALTGCNSVKTDYTNKMVIVDANLTGVDLQTGFEPVTGTPLPKLQMGEVDATYITIPLQNSKNAEIILENRTNSIWGQESYLQRKITVKSFSPNN